MWSLTPFPINQAVPRPFQLVYLEKGIALSDENQYAALCTMLNERWWIYAGELCFT